ncbi:MAG: Wzz/FepE/Etk N-terminal domain-containing protein [Intestinibacter sp.]|uniref:YveK family protein n=1 Tax=Intestinibacter sp. TaxID=1965304 RepID=UPI002A7FF12E|nr:Wzz/FepE/Etk N-terminal domain-containing protein [Intestinibacter sp.]MDY4573494.1 Wzz/FepE/Etk N-terminal domain-containing protein [Intestinibacter sp.]
MEETIDLRELFKIIKRKIWMIVLIGLIFGIVSGVVSVFFITPMYQSSTTLIVNKENSNSETQLSNSDDINYVQKLAYTYSEIITSRAVLGKTISQLGLDISYKKLASCVTVTNITNTQIIKVDVLYKDPKTAREICDTIPAVFDKEIQRIMKVSGVEVIDKAIVSSSPVKPNKIKNVILASAFGVLLGICIAIVQSLMDTKIKTSSDIKEHLDIPVLGIIPKQK